MRICMTDVPAFSQPNVGNVYPIAGGWGRKQGHLMVLIAITQARLCLMLVVDKNGEPTGVTSYGLHAIEERSPVAFVSGLEELSLVMEPLS